MNIIIRASVFAMLCLFLIQCKKKDNAPSERHANLIGRWRLTAYAKDVNNNGSIDSSERSPAPNDPVSEQEFLSDGKGKAYLIISGHAVVNDFRWSLENNETTLRFISNPGLSNESTQDAPILALTPRELTMYYAGSIDTGYTVFSKL